MQYYIEVKDAGGKLVAQSGSPASPNIVYLEPKAKAHYYKEESAIEPTTEAPKVDEAGGAGEGIDDENPLAGGRGVKPVPREAEAEAEVEAGGGDDQAPNKERDGKTNWVKWGTTGGAVALLGTSVALYFTASSYAQKLEDDTHRSCTPSPCVFDDYSASLQSTGKSMELWSNITLGAGVATAAVAGYFWYKDLKRPKHKAQGERSVPVEEDASLGLRFAGAPMIGPGVIGGAAVIEF